MSVRYFFDLRLNEDGDRYLINLVICAANIRQGFLDADDEEDAALLDALALGQHDHPPNNFLNNQTLRRFYDVLDRYLQEGRINRAYYATL